MKLEQALKKSNVVARESEPDLIFEKRGQDLYAKGEDEIRELRLIDIEADDWIFQITKVEWFGGRSKKAEK